MSENNRNSIKSIAKQLLPKSTRQVMRKYPTKVRGQIKRLTIQPALQVADPQTIMCMLYTQMPFTPERIIQAYQQGMYIIEGEDKQSVAWENPAVRCHIPIDDFYLSKRMRQYIRQRRFEIRVDTDFEGVIAACAERDVSWITPVVIENYLKLHEIGIAHSIEAYQEGGLVGGLLGMSIGSYFTSESLFYRVSRASKIVFAYVGIALKAAGYLLHDTQETNDLNSEFGSMNIDREDFQHKLTHALIRPNSFPNTEQINQYVDEAVPQKSK